jgi:hypothetical protein
MHTPYPGGNTLEVFSDSWRAFDADLCIGELALYRDSY